VSFFVKKWLF